MNSKISLTEATEYLIFLLEKEYGKAEARSVSRIAIEEFSGKKTFKEDDFLPLAQLGNFESMCARLRKHEPVQYILGQADFYGLKFNVDNNVLIPRQETEELVVWIAETIQNGGSKQGKLLDIGTGSGCIPITIAKKIPNWEYCGWDISEGALEVAESNNRLNDTKVFFEKVDIFKPGNKEGLSFDIIVSNPPYISKSEAKLMPKRVLKHEPSIALFVEDPDTLLFYKTIANFAKKHLNPGGYLFFECNEFNAREVVAFLDANGFGEVSLKQDILEKDRMIRARM
jgi:release factor glutamine methyltransferase